MKVALVHDYLREYGGAERVVEVFHEMWPEAPLYTSFVDWEALGDHAVRFKDWDIRTSWVQDNPIVRKFHSPLRFLAPKVWESFNLSGYDVVISSSGWYMCRGVKVPKSAVHICYIHHPPRNLYGYATGSTVQKYPLVKAYTTIINFFLRHYDFNTAQKVDYFVANSKETARRVKKFYRRESKVIYPPIEVTKGTSLTSQGSALQNTYYLSVGRLSYAKRVDLVIEAANRLKLPLKIVGTGKDEEALKTLAGPTVEFLGNVSDEALDRLYTDAKALIFCALDEDFGMVPVEAMGHGVPVIGLSQGGVKETVVNGKTGILFETPEIASLIEGVKRFEKEKNDWSKASTVQAKKFSKERFMKEMREFVDRV